MAKTKINDVVNRQKIIAMETLLESEGWKLVAKELDNLKKKLVRDIIVGKDENGEVNLTEKRNELKYISFAISTPKLILDNLKGTKVLPIEDNYDEFDPDTEEDE